MAGAGFVRQRLTLPAETTRSMEERIAVRLPKRWPAAVVRLVRSLSPASRARKAFTHRTVRLALEAANRNDFGATFILAAEGMRMINDQRLVALGFEPEYRGLPARIAFQERWVADWGR